MTNRMGVLFKALGLGFSAAVVSCLVAGGASAGERLKLQIGSVALVDQSQQILAQGLGVDSNAASVGQTFVIQFKNIIGQSDQAALKAHGLQTLRYLPDDALVIRGTAAQAAAARAALKGVNALVAMSPEWKVETALLLNQEASLRMVVSAYTKDDLAAVLARVKALPGVKAIVAEDRDVVVDANASQVRALAQIEGVEWIQELPVFTDLNMDLGAVAEQQVAIQKDAAAMATTGFESGTKLMGFDAAYARGFKGTGQIASMADTGVDTGVISTMHADLKNQITQGYAMGLGGTTWNDPMGHGTHVAGSIVGTGEMSGGVIHGGAIGATLKPEGMWSPILNNLAPPTDMNKLMGTPFRDGARIHSNSWGSPNNPGAYDAYAVKMDDFMWNNPDMLLVFAAGNNGADLDKDGHIDEGSVLTPGTAKNVLTVGASENLISSGGIQKTMGELRDGATKWGVEPIKSDKLSDNPDGMAAFSSRGPTKDGRLKPEICAPGTNIVSTRSHDPKAELLWGAYDDNYLWSGGTSMATPLVSGAATVMRGFLVQARSLVEPSAAVVKAALIHSAHDLFPGQYGKGAGQEFATVRPNVHEGYGRVDLDQGTLMGQETLIVDDKAGVATGEEKARTVHVPSGAKLRATLVYTDAPGAAAAAKALVNDLDVRVTDGGGKVYEKADRLNNTEMLELEGLAGGDYKVAVKGVNVPTGKSGKQPYALLISVITQ